MTTGSAICYSYSIIQNIFPMYFLTVYSTQGRYDIQPALKVKQFTSTSQCWSFDVQNAIAKVKNTGGNTRSISLSRRFDKSPDFASCLALFLFWETLLLFIYLLCERIQAYSRMAKMMNPMHAMIHCIMAVIVPPDFGADLWVEFKVLTAQRKRVNKRPRRPGIASFGTMKLI